MKNIELLPQGLPNYQLLARVFVQRHTLKLIRRSKALVIVPAFQFALAVQSFGAEKLSGSQLGKHTGQYVCG